MVNSHLDEAISTFQNLPADKLLQPAANGGWSIAQCLEHLNRYGNYYIPLLQQKLNTYSSSKDTFASTWLGNFFTNMMDPVKSPQKTPAMKAYKPLPDLDAPAVVAEFIRQQEVLLSCLKQAETADIDRIRIPISISRWIRLKAGDVLQFVIVHDERHILQAKRNLA